LWNSSTTTASSSSASPSAIESSLGPALPHHGVPHARPLLRSLKIASALLPVAHRRLRDEEGIHRVGTRRSHLPAEDCIEVMHRTRMFLRNEQLGMGRMHSIYCSSVCNKAEQVFPPTVHISWIFRFPRFQITSVNFMKSLPKVTNIKKHH
jgi:hypothetical protein